ncbi:BamA/TamA family outer membrane protein [bacterium]|nr:BamA/TamA family outer membrane protein [bacterium]
MTHADSVKAWQEAVENDNALDVTGDVIGEVVFFPLRVVFTGVREGARIVSEEQLIAKVDDLLSSDDGTRRVVPIASPTTGLGAKFKYKPDPTIKANIALLGAWWTYGRQTYRLHAEKWPLLPNVTGHLAGEYHLYPDERYYGIGMASKKSDEVFYRHEATFAELGLGFNLHRWLELTAHGDYRANNLYNSVLKPTVDVDTYGSVQNLSPYSGRIDLVSTELALEFNTSINPARPMNGFVTKVSGGYHNQVGDDVFGYWDSRVLIGKYFHIMYERVLYFDIAGQFTEPLNDRVIPFFELPELGGRETLRGFKRGRYSGEHTVQGTVEYRLPIRDIWSASGFDFAFFADWGKVVQDDVSDWDMDSMQIGYGFSLQTWTLAGAAARLDVGFSREGTRLYFTMGL